MMPMKKRRAAGRSALLWAMALTAVLVAAAFYLATRNQTGNDATRPGPATGHPNSSSVETGHPRVFAPATLGGQRAENVYQAILGELLSRYALSDDPVAVGYSGWRRYNRVPYRSAPHGEHLVNNYANALASDYGRFASGKPMPEGAIVAKDSFAVTAGGAVLAGPLFLMERMAPGFDRATGDWRYIMIDVNGEVVGITGGINAQNVRFCNRCHAKAPKGQDRLFFVPKAAQIPFE